MTGTAFTAGGACPVVSGLGTFLQPGIKQQPGPRIGFIVDDPEFGITLGKGNLPERGRQLVIPQQAGDPLLGENFLEEPCLQAIPVCEYKQFLHEVIISIINLYVSRGRARTDPGIDRKGVNE